MDGIVTWVATTAPPPPLSGPPHATAAGGGAGPSRDPLRPLRHPPGPTGGSGGLDPGPDRAASRPGRLHLRRPGGPLLSAGVPSDLLVDAPPPTQADPGHDAAGEKAKGGEVKAGEAKAVPGQQRALAHKGVGSRLAPHPDAADAAGRGPALESAPGGPGGGGADRDRNWLRQLVTRREASAASLRAVFSRPLDVALLTEHRVPPIR